MAEATPTPSPSAASLARWRLTVRGVVQGVGFRPFVYRLAQQYRLSGHVGNDTAGVFIEVQGQPEQLAAFRAELLRQPPPLAQIDTHTCEAITPHPDERDFRILESGSRAGPTTAVPADIATCPDCLRELHDPADRRYRYPFINCTHCGPRFTIIRSLPYDRPTTTMASFALCPACAREYHDPADRRFHAQPVACPVCGPHLSLVDAAGQTVAARDEALREAAARLAAGQVVAVKGIGGFHLACDATNPSAVATLRARKGRGEKPFAVMVRDLAQARAYAQIDAHEERLLVGAERPIVLVRRLDHQPGDATAPARALADAVAPGTDTLGLFLPYSPLHHLLLAEPALGGVPLVMTSGNRSDEPIARDNDEALTRLAGLADAWLLHNRDIHTVCDDSVVRVLLEREYPLRRSRGYVPLPVRLPRAVPPVLAVGGELKATLCVTTGDYAILSQHIGDVESPETLAALDRTAAHLLTTLLPSSRRGSSATRTRAICRHTGRSGGPRPGACRWSGCSITTRTLRRWCWMRPGPLARFWASASTAPATAKTAASGAGSFCWSMGRRCGDWPTSSRCPCPAGCQHPPSVSAGAGASVGGRGAVGLCLAVCGGVPAGRSAGAGPAVAAWHRLRAHQQHGPTL
jgi:hydrogenase maturation protein HypF